MTYKNKQLKKARESIRKGQNIAESLRVMRNLATAGDGGAAASLVQVLAYQQDWTECIEHCIVALETQNTDQIFSFAVKEQTLDILARAGQETKSWSRIVEFAKKKFEELTDNCYPPNSPVYYQKILALADRNGLPPNVRNTGTAPLRKYDGDINAVNSAKTFQRFLDAHAEAQTDSEELVFRKFLAAMENSYCTGAIELWEEHRATIEQKGRTVLTFPHILTLSKMYLDGGNDDGAWKVIAEHLHYWIPLDKCQVLPVALLADTEIRELMTSPRCEFVLNADKTLRPE